MRRFIFWLLFPAMAILNHSCQSYSYIPPTIPVPMMDRAGEFQMSGGLQAPEEISVFMSYAVTDHLNLHLGYSTGHYMGIGYTLSSPLGRRVRGVMEIQGGASRNGAYHYRAHPDSFNETRLLTEYMVQPSLGIRTNVVDLAVSLRFLKHRIQRVGNGSFFMEPFGTLKLGYKYIKLVVQYGSSTCLVCNGGAEFEERLYPTVFLLGLQVDIPTRKQTAH